MRLQLYFSYISVGKLSLTQTVISTQYCNLGLDCLRGLKIYWKVFGNGIHSYN